MRRAFGGLLESLGSLATFGYRQHVLRGLLSGWYMGIQIRGT
jgi:hypothetical protein